MALLLGFTFFMGLILSRMLGVVLGMSNGGASSRSPSAARRSIFATMASIAATTKRDLSGMGKFLFVGVIMLLVASFANIFLQLPALMIAVSLIAIGIFSAYMLYDVNRIVTGGETNYISATLALYLDVYNVFVNLLVAARDLRRQQRLTATYPQPRRAAAAALRHLRNARSTPRARCAETCSPRRAASRR